MAIQKRPYELSVWVEKLNGSNSKIEEKGVIIGAHDMSYLGKATNIVLKREIKGTNTLTFQMPDKYFDSLTGDYIHNDFIDMIYPESKLKLFYKDRWFEFFVKKVDEKKQFKSYMKSFTCTDAFIDELSRNGYGITYDTDLYNNVEEIGTFTEETLDDSIWQYYPENNWGDFTEFKEEKLYRIPISCFGGTISGYKLNFELTKKQKAEVKEKYGTDTITNLFTKAERDVELSDDLARGEFWDQYVEDGNLENPLTKEYHSNIDNDGYIYVPYSCLSFCYGSEEEPDFSTDLSYDRAATETAISIEDKLILAPQSVDPRTIIQFYAIPNNAVLELDEDGVILNKDYSFFMTLSEWNRAVSWGEDKNWWYIFEDTRLVPAETLGASDLAEATISHTFRYLKNTYGKIGEEEGVNIYGDTFLINGTDNESKGNKCVTYEGYLSDVNDMSIVKGKKFSITDRTELNISKEIDQYVTVYNVDADDFSGEYTNEDWDYTKENRTKVKNSTYDKYRVASKLATRQIVPQLARNLVQNGTDMDSTDGWAPMTYLTDDSVLTSPAMELRGVSTKVDQDENITTSALVYYPSAAQSAYYQTLETNAGYETKEARFSEKVFYTNAGKVSANDLGDNVKNFLSDNSPLLEGDGDSENKEMRIYTIGVSVFYKKEENGIISYNYLCDKNDWFYRGLKTIYSIGTKLDIDTIPPNKDGQIIYYIQYGNWIIDGENTYIKNNGDPIQKQGNVNNGRKMVNFGIIGQDKKIEKDKIYCLGVSGFSTSAFNILIGKGSLISEGEYTLSDKTVITFASDIDLNISSVSSEDWASFKVDDEKSNINLSEKDLKPKFLLFKVSKEIENPYFVVESTSKIVLLKLYLFEAYTKGIDSFVDDNLSYRYSGRDLFWPPKHAKVISKGNYEIAHFIDADSLYIYDEDYFRTQVIFEDDIMLGSTYGYQQYFIQRLKTHDDDTYDTLGVKSFISSNKKEINRGINGDSKYLPLDAAKYTEDDYEIQTNYIDLNKCPFYNSEADISECDCSYGTGHTCFYQKFGYCPYRFKTEKHNRRIRTLSISKSNRFNIIQETSKVFEVYPQFFIEHKTNGKVIQDSEGNYIKKVFFITEKGRENKIGFRYEKNLKDISRNIVSDKIVTKLYVLDVDSELSKTGLCSIKTAEDNPSKDSYIIDFSYYVQKGMLDAAEVEQDLYGVTPTSAEITGDEIPSGFLYQLGYYNNEYDKLSNKIINLQDASYNELEANLTVNYEGIITAQEQILKIKKQLEKYKQMYQLKDGGYEEQATYQNYKVKLAEQEAILVQLIQSTFFTNGKCDIEAFKYNDLECFDVALDDIDTLDPYMDALTFFSLIINIEDSKTYWWDRHNYRCGILGQFNKEYLQIQQWKRERASYLKLINQISSAFYKKYEPYLKEGTWSDSNYLTDNAYYFGALDVAAEGAIPKVSYTINVIDIAPLNEEYEEIYDFDLADITYIEDIGMFDINKHTGLPNRLKVLVSAVSEGLDNPDKDTISVQNFTTSFQDLFQQVSASVQSLTYNENIYKRSANFTSLQNITNSSLQGALDTNELTLLDTDEDNIQVDNTGTRGSDINNHANKYKLDGQGLFFSNDGGQHWSVGVGPSGINADYIKVGTLDAGKIRIADSSYVYFSWDKDGIVAYRDPQGINTDAKNINDAAIFNKYGLSIVNDGNIKLRAGYRFNGIEGGKINSESSLADEIGFYLYNTAGNVIFSTATSTASEDKSQARDTAAIYLVGEMLVTNDDNQISSITDYTYSGKVTREEHDLYSITDSDIDNSTVNITQDGDNYIIVRVRPNKDDFYLAYVAENKNLQHGNKVILKNDIEDETGDEYEFSDLIKENTLKYCTKNTNTYFTIVSHTCNYKNKTIRYYIFSNMQTGIKSPLIFNNLQSSIGKVYTVPPPDGTSTTSPILYNTQRWEPVITNTYDKTDPTYHFKYEIGDSKSVTYIEGKGYYTSRTNGTATKKEGSVGLYLNNKTDLNQHVDFDGDKASRLFVCCYGTGGNVTNIFSILKNGNLYIGGDIADETDPTNLSDQIKIDNAGIFIEAGGKLKMDFNHIQDPEGGSLTDYIGEQIANSQDALKLIMDSMVKSATSGLSGDGHWHSFDTRVSWSDDDIQTYKRESKTGNVYTFTNDDNKRAYDLYVQVYNSGSNSIQRCIRLTDICEFLRASGSTGSAIGG